MSLPFRRTQGAADALTRSAFSLAQRRWAVEALLCTLTPEVQHALAPWLLAPTNLKRWPPPTTFEPRRLPFDPEAGRGQSHTTLCDWLYDELKAIRQTLDLPPEALSGLTRNGLLVAHGIRLRQLEGWLWPRWAARHIRRMIASPNMAGG